MNLVQCCVCVCVCVNLLAPNVAFTSMKRLNLVHKGNSNAVSREYAVIMKSKSA